ncbi:DUF6236 family protein [Paenibacillus sp. D2_2]|uniref:DUF6236 family protein n=1 Tax=Paenibacillus sp. D2_2 TaxID=3073092 RepID=UPI002814FE3A|nr:DUF6236 family protein [Paenibacillus sp. D2_2]WMT41748.1 DUF6236 family protein [Paenibacillus sp. D2_2]
MERILYYPYIAVPNTKWLTHALLYWDEVASIVPSDYFNQPELHDPYMLELVKANLVRQLPPLDEMGTPTGFVDGFIEILERLLPKSAAAVERKVEKRFARIHSEKMFYNIYHELRVRGIAREGDGPWYEVEEQISMWFMLYLAAYIGKRDNYTPITDKRIPQIHLYPGPKPKGKEILNPEQIQSRRRNRTLVLQGLLPVPRDNVQLEDIIKFKEKYGTQLKKFRSDIEVFLLDLEIHPVNQVDERIKHFVINKNLEIEELVRKMDESWGITLLDIARVGSILTSFIQTIADKSVLSFTNATTSALTGVHDFVKSKGKAELLSHPLAYAALYQRKDFRSIYNR